MGSGNLYGEYSPYRGKALDPAETPHRLISGFQKIGAEKGHDNNALEGSIGKCCFGRVASGGVRRECDDQRFRLF
jgi:hypothetical protein